MVVQVQAWFAKYLANGAPGRRKLSVRVAPSKACTASSTGAVALESTVVITDLDAYKMLPPLWPPAPRGALPAPVGTL